RAGAQRLHSVADQLVAAFGLVDGEPAARHQREAVLHREAQPARLGAEKNGVQARLGVLQGEVEMATARRLEVRNLAFDEELREPALEYSLDFTSQFRDRKDLRPFH